MKANSILALAFLCTFLGPLTSQRALADDFNSYQWNRKHEIRRDGKIDHGPWYEWWYYKTVDPSSGQSFYFVYGVVNPWDHTQTKPSSRAYVGFGDFSNNEIVENIFQVNQFQAKYNETRVEIADQVATDHFIIGHLTGDMGEQYHWNLAIDHSWSYNAMGWAMRFSDIINIYWYPAQADAFFSGTISTPQQTIFLDHAPSYQDRNWGRSFPKWWAWIVSNHFPNSPGTALTVGGGKPTILGAIKFIEGVSIGLKHQGKEYHWRPNDLDFVRVDIRFGKWEIVAINKKNKIKISAYAPKEKFMDLKFLSPQNEVFHDYETLTGHLNFTLYQRKSGGWRKTLSLESEAAGIEFGSHQSQDFDRIFEEEVRLNP